MNSNPNLPPRRGLGLIGNTTSYKHVAPLALSPAIPLQREFARRVTAVEALKTAQRASLAELDALFASLQHRACSNGSCNGRISPKAPLSGTARSSATERFARARAVQNRVRRNWTVTEKLSRRKGFLGL